MKFLFWASRILAILLILFVSIFALDVFGQGAGFWKTALGLFIHLLPSIFLAVVVWLTWRKPLFAGIIFLFLAFSYLFSGKGEYLYKLPIFVPGFLVGVLYGLEFFIGRKRG